VARRYAFVFSGTALVMHPLKSMTPSRMDEQSPGSRDVGEARPVSFLDPIPEASSDAR
jgi:hypothetical protein